MPRAVNQRLRSAERANGPVAACLLACGRDRGQTEPVIDAQYLTGRLLLAMPGMADPRFERSVNLICSHDETGALALNVGKLREGVRLHAILEELEIDPGLAPDCEVYEGGPVEPGRGFILHSPDWSSAGTMQIGDICAMSASMQILKAIAEGAGPSRWLMALGYAGWGAGQLEQEMRQHGWCAARGSRGILFDVPIALRWKEAWQGEGIDPALLASETGSA